jgi:hypothetical protein
VKTAPSVLGRVLQEREIERECLFRRC